MLKIRSDFMWSFYRFRSKLRSHYSTKLLTLCIVLFVFLYAVSWRADQPGTSISDSQRVKRKLDDNQISAIEEPPAAGLNDEQKVIQAPIHVDVDRTETVRHVGPGEMGEAVVIDRESLGEEEKRQYDLGFERNSFNQYASDMISVKRSLPDMRPPSCKKQKYLKQLPETSVIICFHNEAWSTLLRSVHSILDRTPSHLLKEIILVDDASEQEHLKNRLEEYFYKYPKVKFVRSPARVGLIKARLMGYEVATGAVLTFLDSHIECTEGWVEPLLDRIARDPTNVVWPVIDIISDQTFEYKNDPDAGSQVGGFDWGLQFNWHVIPDKDKNAPNRKFKTDPVHSPTMAGGLFSIDRAYFEKLGTYDPDFDIWGGENLEISFKTWMCGGTLEMIPCSRVGHVFRDKSPYKWRAGTDVLKKNLVRLAKVWMDDYANYYFERINDDLGDYGDISERVALRKSLNCKSFQWYIDNVYPELYIPGKAQAWGEIRNKGFASAYCMDADVETTDPNKTVDLYPCHNQGGNQHWSLSNGSEIRRDDFCVDLFRGRLKTMMCHGMKGNQEWLHDRNTGFLRNPASDLCMEASDDLKSIVVRGCDESNPNQQWRFKTYAGDPKPEGKKKQMRRRES